MSDVPRIPYRRDRLDATDMDRRASDFYAEMDARRSVRDFSSDAVPRRLVELAIRTASTAPSGAHQQPWTFVAVSDPVVKRRIRVAAEAEERRSYEGRMSEEWLEALAPIGTDWQKPFLDTVPWIVVLFEQVHGSFPDGRHKKHYYARESVGIAAGLFVGALHHMGLATLTHTPSPMGFLREILERPANERPFILFPWATQPMMPACPTCTASPWKRSPSSSGRPRRTVSPARSDQAHRRGACRGDQSSAAVCSSSSRPSSSVRR